MKANKFNDLQVDDFLFPTDEKDLHTYEQCLNEAGIKYEVDSENLVIKVKGNGKKQS